MTQKRYVALTAVKWLRGTDADAKQRDALWVWCRQMFGDHGELWSANFPGKGGRVEIVTLCPEHHALVMLTWG